MLHDGHGREELGRPTQRLGTHEVRRVAGPRDSHGARGRECRAGVAVDSNAGEEHARGVGLLPFAGRVNTEQDPRRGEVGAARVVEFLRNVDGRLVKLREARGRAASRGACDDTCAQHLLEDERVDAAPRRRRAHIRRVEEVA